MTSVPIGTGTFHGYAATAISIFTRVTGKTELLDVAELAARRALSLTSILTHNLYYARTGLALIAIQRRDAESANEQYLILESMRGTRDIL